MKRWESAIMPAVDPEHILASPEYMDPKTDACCNWKKHGSLSGFFASDKLTDVSKMSDEALIDVMDVLLAKESLFFQGRNAIQSVCSFVYVARMHELKAKNAILYAYTRATLRVMDFVIQFVSSSPVVDEEEFLVPPSEFHLYSECSIDEIIAELDAAIALTKNSGIVQRLQYRRQILSAFPKILCSSPADVADLVAVLNTAGESLKAIQKSRKDQPTRDEGLFRDEDMSVWVTSSVPVPVRPVPEFQGALNLMIRLFQDVASFEQIVTPRRSISDITDFLEVFALKKPILLARCIVFHMLLSRNPNVSLLFGPSLPEVVLETTANTFGAPIYAKVLEGDETLLKMLAMYSGNRQNATRFGREATEAVRRWVMRVTRVILQIWEALLCNRGRTYRRLTNLLENLAELQVLSMEIDNLVFMATRPTTTPITKQLERDMALRSGVLTAYSFDLTYVVQLQLLQLMQELQLLSNTELLPVLFHMQHVATCRLENFNVLHLTSPQYIPDRGVGRTGAPVSNPTLTTRFPTAVPVALHLRIDSARLSADLAFRALIALENAKLINLDSPKHSLVSAAESFDMRMIAFRMLHQPTFIPYERCYEHQKTIAAMSTPLNDTLRKISSVCKQVSEKTKPFAQNTEAAGSLASKEIFAALEKTARLLHVSLNLLVTLEPAALASFDVSVDYPANPGLASIALKRKVAA
eukprot:CAMPEP_0176425588 /NCGR_PEP_ID=MMETSP0127-20121128/11470_1 /TAXON_ID=938130 /ORGANISM="Platyophrya macrostoma, Strain WH" /LENGTH=697 /DNA_ID=CAMNT_0017806761 /DNA_START=102 /DNA_END=2195 /DNA_ORIENTATION=-